MIRTTINATEITRIRRRSDAELEHLREDPEILRRLDADESLVHALGLTVRPGVMRFMTSLEYDHFNPLADREPLFELRFVVWMDQMFALATIPIADWPLFHSTAAKTGLCLCDGVPAAISHEGAYFFPMISRRTCTLESTSPVPDDPARRKALLEQEMADCEAIHMAARDGFRERSAET